MRRRGDFMLHYHVWFNLKPGIGEDRGLQIVAGYLSQLSAAAESAGFRLLKNAGSAPKSKLPKYHALVEFTGFDQLGAAMKKQTERGIHGGRHGEIVEVVCDFHVEIFTSAEMPAGAPASREIGAYACEV